MNSPQYIKWFVEESEIELEDGLPIMSYRLDYKIDESVYCEWAKHIRQHYESDEELTDSLDMTGLTAEEYLKTFVIPQKSDAFGPTARSNDFTEIMVSDLLEFVQGYSVPSCKQRNKSGKGLSEHGTDILAYKFSKQDKSPNSKDELLAVEVKAGLSKDHYTPISNAVNDSIKYDEVRHSLTLNYYRKKLKSICNYQQSDEIARFQKKSENDYIVTYIAAAIVSRNIIPNNTIIGIRGDDFELRQNNKIFLVHGEKLMSLAHAIFERCVK